MTERSGDTFVGRAGELRRLTEACHDVAAGRGRVVLVSGTAGIGKTRFCEEGAAAAGRLGLTAVWGRCWTDGGAPALWPWQPVLTELCGPETAGLLDQDAGRDTVDPERFSRFVAVGDQLAEACGRTPAYLVIDDLHAADSGAALLARFVARMRHRLPLLLVITIRAETGDDRARQLVDWLAPEATLISLRQFTVDDTRDFLTAHGVVDVEPGLLSAVQQVTGGNPLYLHRLLALGAPDPARGLPDGIRNVVDESVRRLAPPALPVLAVGAVLGATPSVAETAAVAGVEAAAVLGAVAAAADAGLVTRVGPDAFAFSHDLVREAVAGTLSSAERFGVHARAAAALAGWTAVAAHERLARRAHHATNAAPRSPADAREAVAACQAAAQSMVERFDYEQAAALLATAAGLHEQADLGPPPAALLLAWASAVLPSGRLAEARALFDRAAAAAQAQREPVLFAQAALGLGGVWVNEHRERAERERVLALQRAALDGLGADQEVLRCRLRTRLAAELVYSGGPLDDVLAALEETRRLGDGRALAEALSLTHHALLRPDHTAFRLALAEELVGTASAAGDGVLVLMGLCWQTVDLFHLGDPRAERALTDLRTRAEALSCHSIQYVVAVLEVMLLIRAGELAAAEESAATCFRLGTEVGDADALAYYGAHLLAIRWLQGRGAELLDLAAEVADSPTLVQAEFAFQASVAHLAAEAGQLTRARQALDRLAAGGLDALPQSSTWLAGMLAIVEAAAALGDAGLARQAYDLLLPYAALPIRPSLAVVCFGSVERPLGLAALTQDDLDTAIYHLERAVATNIRLGNRPLAACARAELARALSRRGTGDDHRQAAELLRLAAGEAEAMGMSERAERWRLALPAETGDDPAGVLIRRAGAHWTVSHSGRQVLVDDLVGMSYLARLVEQPGNPIAAIELAAGGGPQLVEPPRQDVLDDRARAAYLDRSRELLGDLAEAREQGDSGRVEQIQAEIDALADELDSATGLGGRPRSFTGPAERARTAVRKAIKRAVDSIDEVDPAIAAELRAGVSTGYHCCYLPRPYRAGDPATPDTATPDTPASDTPAGRATAGR